MRGAHLLTKSYLENVNNVALNSVTIVCDPISTGNSVQLNLVRMVIKCLSNKAIVNVVSPYVPEDQTDQMRNLKVGEIISLSKLNSVYKLVMDFSRGNESMLWGLSWLFEAFFNANSSRLNRIRTQLKSTKIINISYTVPVKCVLFWNQATPPVGTLKGMGQYNILARLVFYMTWIPLKLLDSRILSKHLSNSSTFVNNSEYLKNLYSSMGFKSGEVINVPKDFSLLSLPQGIPTRDYVLVYIGKEVEIDTILNIANQGVKIVGFGGKIPIGTSMDKLRDEIDFKGFVDEAELSTLYFNALYTLFPFTDEPFGWVPLESMHFGTPVLSYNKQGPSETIVDGHTGWLVESKREIITRAVDIWSKKETRINPKDCRERAEVFSIAETREKLLKAIGEI